MINSAAEDDRSHLRTPPGQAPAVTPGIERLLPLSDAWTPPNVSPALARFKNNWEGFIDSLIREWKTLNLVSALLLSAILTMFQIPDAATDPVTRNAALLSLICALMSLTYGCIYIVRFGTMRSMYRASRWAEEAQKTNTAILWNVWVLLAMPAVWLSWSMVMFITTILSFVWRTGAVDDPEERDPLPVHIALAPRIIITAVFGLGMVYFALIVHSLKSYGGRAAARRKAQRSPRVLQGEPAARRGGEGTMRNQSATAGLQGHAGQNGHAGENRHAGQNGHVAQNGHAGFTTKEAVKGDEWRGRERERRSRSASDELKKGVTGGVHITSEAVSGDPNGFEEKR
ncbi:hypothetical protein BD626DRAFT_394244 [Schizophyllum amplum]|uniref:Uncharacterized protein n=1 Tax=Schizophyllum amplum TaxID=97359 RepID=A0A550CVA4_9AGAR|nr:hypothetical protein BD626DRAFT_394244 [Auriculariopsis ampla]